MPRSPIAGIPAELKVGRFFAAEVVACSSTPSVCEIPDPCDHARAQPRHGLRPAAAHAAPGHYKFTGLMLLHMAGTWRLTIDLVQASKRTRLTHEVKLAP